MTYGAKIQGPIPTYYFISASVSRLLLFANDWESYKQLLYRTVCNFNVKIWNMRQNLMGVKYVYGTAIRILDIPL